VLFNSILYTFGHHYLSVSTSDLTVHPTVEAVNLAAADLTASTPAVESKSELESMIGKSREIRREQKDTR
jgi:hypothetical protein